VHRYVALVEQGFEAHCVWLQGMHGFTHDSTLQQLSHWCWNGQKVALEEQPPEALPLVHWKGVWTAQRDLPSHSAVVHERLHEKRAAHSLTSQHFVHSLVLFHALWCCEQPPFEGPLAQK